MKQEWMVLEVESTVSLRCGQCQSRNVIGWGRFPRDFRVPSIGDKGLIIRYAVPRVECRRCGTVRQVKVEFAPGPAGVSKVL